MTEDMPLLPVGAGLIILGFVMIIIDMGTIFWGGSEAVEALTQLSYGLIGCGAFMVLISFSSNVFLKRAVFSATVFVVGFLMLRDESLSTSRLFGSLIITFGVLLVIGFTSMTGKPDRATVRLRMIVLGTVFCVAGLLLMLGNFGYFFEGLGDGILYGGIVTIALILYLYMRGNSQPKKTMAKKKSKKVINLYTIYTSPNREKIVCYLQLG